MSKKNNIQKYDLEDRTERFANYCRDLVKALPEMIVNFEDGKQLVRSSGSVAANYIEANESLSKKDFIYRIKLCRKEAKESRMWLSLLSVNDPNNEKFRTKLRGESCQLVKIFSSIVSKIR